MYSQWQELAEEYDEFMKEFHDENLDLDAISRKQVTWTPNLFELAFREKMRMTVLYPLWASL